MSIGGEPPQDNRWRHYHRDKGNGITHHYGCNHSELPEGKQSKTIARDITPLFRSALHRAFKSVWRESQTAQKLSTPLVH